MVNTVRTCRSFTIFKKKEGDYVSRPEDLETKSTATKHEETHR
jgi:hypothetical protein